MNMLSSLGLSLIFETSLVVYLGILALLSLLLTCLIAILNHKGNHKIPFKWHKITASVTIILIIVHVLLALLH
jgi:hypothetical protein